jgi:hypothetical protein
MPSYQIFSFLNIQSSPGIILGSGYADKKAVYLIQVMIDTSLPLVELHRHLDGNIRLQTILELGRQHNIPLPAWEVENLRPHVQVTDPQPGVMAFITKFRWPMAVLVDAKACVLAHGSWPRQMDWTPLLL